MNFYALPIAPPAELLPVEAASAGTEPGQDGATTVSLPTVRPQAPLPARAGEAPAPTPQPAVFVRGQEVPGSRAEIMLRPSVDDELLAHQKALFCEEVWELAESQKIAASAAAAFVALQVRERYPALAVGGKCGRSLVAGAAAYHNYRAWARRLGRAAGGRPDGENWRALCDRYRGSRVYERPGALEAWILLARLYEHPNKIALSAAYRMARLAWDRNAPGRAAEFPSESAVRHYYDRHADRKAVAIAREGEEYYRNRIAGYIRRQAPEVDEVWFSDHHIFDAAVRVLGDDNRWHAVRPWLTAWMDWGSLAFVGWQIRAVSPNRDAIERALRVALDHTNYRPPVHLYVDNGKDFKARGFSRPMLREPDVAQLTSVAGILKCKVHFALPYNARAKVIEPRFRIVADQFSRLWESYRGNRPDRRPEAADAAWGDPDRLPTLAQFREAFGRWYWAMYHTEKSEGEILAGRSPAEARAQAKPLRPPLDGDQIHKAFLREAPGLRLVRRGGEVVAFRRTYTSEALWKLWDGKTCVRVRVNPDDLSEAWIYTADGQEIGMATDPERLPALTEKMDPETIERFREALRRQRRQVAEAKAQSAEQRGYGRYRRLPEAGASAVFGLLPQAEDRPIGPDAAPAVQDAAPAAADPELAAELEALLREETRAKLASDMDREIDAGDAALLDEILAEQAAERLAAAEA